MSKNKKEPYIEPGVYEKLPKELQNITSYFKDREKDIVLLSSIGVLSNCFPNIKGQYDRKKYSPHLYIMIIAPPASGKGVMDNTKHLLSKIDDKIYKETERQKKECEQENKDSDKPRKCPEIEIKILPANISSSQMYRFFKSSKDGLLIIESEADTLTNILKKEWGDFSDVLRKAFHHEGLSISRKTGNLFVKIDEPKLAIVIAGTPNQLKGLIKSRENGLFSRFMIYNFTDISPYRNPFRSKKINLQEKFKEVGNKIFETYMQLKDLNAEITFELTDEQIDKFTRRFPIVRDKVIDTEQRFVSCVDRHGLIAFRIAMVLTALRNRENLFQQTKLVCSDDDFEIALSITKTSLTHTFNVFNTLGRNDLPLQDYKLLTSLPSEFTTQEAYEKGNEQGIKNRTITDKLSQWESKGYIQRVKQGNYINNYFVKA